MDIKQRLQQAIDSWGTQVRAPDGTAELCRDALAEIERLESRCKNLGAVPILFGLVNGLAYKQQKLMEQFTKELKELAPARLGEDS